MGEKEANQLLSQAQNAAETIRKAYPYLYRSRNNYPEIKHEALQGLFGYSKKTHTVLQDLYGYSMALLAEEKGSELIEGKRAEKKLRELLRNDVVTSAQEKVSKKE
jgi:hypothetical protein